MKDSGNIFIVNSKFAETSNLDLQLISDRQFSQFETAVEVRYYRDSQLVDSIIQSDFRMISWYSSLSDTIDLIVHIEEFETSGLLVRFIGDKPQLFHLRASHSGQDYFKLSGSDTFTNQVEVPAIRYKLSISQIPDTINKPVVLGQIELESAGYYDRRDSLEQRHSIKAKVNFRSQYRKFDY